MNNKRCDEGNCDYQVRYLMCTQFAGDHYLCIKHAREMKGFPDGDDSTFFYPETYPVAASHQPASIGVLKRGS